MKKVVLTGYEFHELSAEAKETARASCIDANAESILDSIDEVMEDALDEILGKRGLEEGYFNMGGDFVVSKEYDNETMVGTIHSDELDRLIKYFLNKEDGCLKVAEYLKVAAELNEDYDIDLKIENFKTYANSYFFDTVYYKDRFGEKFQELHITAIRVLEVLAEEELKKIHGELMEKIQDVEHTFASAEFLDSFFSEEHIYDENGLIVL